MASSVTIRVNERGLRVLSLDGGGVRGVSSLLILRHLMKRINHENPPNPCDYFDLIAGTSTGGLIAIMLGRLRMTIQECLDAYQDIAEKVFQPKRSRLNLIGRGKDLWSLDGAFDADELAAAIRRVVVQAGEKADSKLIERKSQCKVFVCALRAETTTPIRLRSYETPTTVQELDCTIVEAARATSAAPSFFKPIVIEGQTFVDGATGYNNPVEEALDEVRMVWPDSNHRIERFLSIGTGKPGMRPFGKTLNELAKTLIKISTETDHTAERFERTAVRVQGLSGLYFRFNARGLENVGLEDYASLERIISATNSYLNEHDTLQKLNAFAAATPSFLDSIQQQTYLQSLRTYDVETELQQVPSPAGSTFQWVLESEEFQSWTESTDHPILLIKGKPGCGKTVLLAYLRRSTVQSTVAFYACNKAENSRRSPEMILSSLLRQILSQQPNLFRYAATRMPGSGPWTYQQLLESFESVFVSPDNTGSTCMIDALDECHEVSRRRFVRDLCRISAVAKARAGYSRIVITTRDYADIDFPSAINLKLDTAPALMEDVHQFIFLRVGQLIEARPHYATDMHFICESLRERADGMYRLVDLVIQDLEYMTDSSPLAIRRVLHSVPHDIGEMYDRILDRISETDLTRARFIFPWMLCSLGPLTLEIIKIAAAIPAALESFNVKTMREYMPSDVTGDLLRLFGPLIRIGSTVEVSHPSVRDHFLGGSSKQCFDCTHEMHSDEAHTIIAMTCLQYLNSFEDSRACPGSDEFLQYSLKYFAKHVALSEPHNDLLDDQILLFFANGYWQSSWEQSCPHDFILGPGIFVPRIEDALTFASYYGRPSIIQKLVSTGDMPSDIICASGFCCHVALRTIYFSIIGLNEECLKEAVLILDKTMLRTDTPLDVTRLALDQDEEPWPSCGSNKSLPNSENGILGTPQRNAYHRLARKIHDIQLGDQVVARSDENRTLLQIRIVKVFRTLLPRHKGKSDALTSLDKEDWTYHLSLIVALYMSWTYGTGVTNLLMPNSPAIIEAVKANRTQVFKVLMNENPSLLTARDKDEAGLLHLAAKTGNYELVKDIIKAKTTDINSVDNKGQTPLHYACSRYDIWDSAKVLEQRPASIARGRVVSLLLRAGANRTVRDHLGNTPLQVLSRVFVPEYDNIPKESELSWRETDLNDTIAVMLQDLRDVIEWDSYGVTPLHYAAYLWPRSAIQQILAFLGTFSVSGGLVDHLGHTPLHYAAFRGFDKPEKVVSLLCQAGIDPRVQQISGETAKDVARIYGRREIMQALGDEEKNVDERSRRAFAQQLRARGDSVYGMGDITQAIEALSQANHLQRGSLGTMHFDSTSVRPVLRLSPIVVVATTETTSSKPPKLISRLPIDPWAKCTDYPSMQLRNQIQRAQQFLSSSRGGQLVNEKDIPREVINLLTLRIYDLRTVEPFGQIDKKPLIRPIALDRLKSITEGPTPDASRFEDADVGLYVPRRHSMALERRSSAHGDEDLEEWEAKRTQSKPSSQPPLESGEEYEEVRSWLSYRVIPYQRFCREVIFLYFSIGGLAMIGSLWDPDLPLGNPGPNGWCDLQRRQRGSGWYLGSPNDQGCFWPAFY